MKALSYGMDSLISRFRKPPLSGFEGYDKTRNFYVTGYPISGNSWIAYVIAYVLNCQYHDIDSPEWSPQRVPLKKFLEGTNDHLGTKEYDWVLKTHAPPSIIPTNSTDRLIYVVRDVHDVANSYFHRLEKTWPGSSDWKRRLLINVAKRLIPFRIRYRYVTRYFSRRWAAQVQEILDASNIPILQYEQFAKHPLETLEQIILSIDPAIWDEGIGRQALETFSFKNMKDAAKQAVTDETKKTDRVGGSGDYKNYFAPADLKWFECEFSNILSEIEVQSKFTGRGVKQSR